jgi:hypothetical protein
VRAFTHDDLYARFEVFIRALPPSSGIAEDKRNQKQDDGHPKQKAGSIHCRAREATETKQARDKGNDQKDDCPMQKIAKIHSCSSKAELPRITALTMVSSKIAKII